MDGVNHIGRAEEISLPELGYVMAEQKPLGLFAKFDLPSGLDKMMAKIKWGSFYPDVLVKVASPFKASSIQVRSSVETWEAGGRTAETPMVTYMTATFKKFPGSTFKQHENPEPESELNVLYFKQVIGGRELVEIDVLANIFKIDGVDQLAQFRANIGG